VLQPFGAAVKAGTWVSPVARVAPRLPIGVLLTTALVALICAFASRLAPDPFDGGVSASGGVLLSHGLVPYRDFWMLYGPLSAVIVALALIWVQPSMALLRGLGSAAVLGQALAGYALARRFTPERSAWLVAAAAVALPTTIIGLELSAWSVGMAIALAALGVGTSERRRAPVLAGALAGLTFLSRPDLGAYVGIALLLTIRSPRVMLGGAVVVLPVALVLLLTVPVSSLVEQLVWYPIVGQREFRSVPWPGIGIPADASLPFFLALVVVPRLAIVAGLVTMARRRSSPTFTALVVFAIACQLQTTSRGDIVHYAQAATPAILLLGRWIPRAETAGLRRALATVALVGPTIALVTAASMFGPRGDDRDLSAAAAHAATLTAADQPIFAGLTSNRHTFNNPLLVYYLADRRTAVRHDTYNPGVTNRDDVQREMVGDLERSATNVVVLDTEFANAFEPTNRSRDPGATILDDYLARTFVQVARYGDFVVAVRIG